MNVRTRLRGAFALYIALLVALSLYHVRTTHRAVASARSLAKIASRLRDVSTTQLTRLAQARDDAERFVVTKDSGYLAKFGETMSLYDAELRTLDTLQLTDGERILLAPLEGEWRRAQSAADSLRRTPVASAQGPLTALARDIDRTAAATQALGAASQEAMNGELDESGQSERSAEQLTVLAAAGAVLLSILLSALLARSILNPIALLKTGTHEVSAGRFGYRLETTGKDELAQVARDFNSMTVRLDELDKMKRDFVSKVSHDLKTPLSSMQETTGALLDGVAGPITEKQRQLLAINHESGRRLSSMLAKLLDLSRIEAGFEPDLQIVDVRQIVRHSVQRLSEVKDGARAGHVALTMDEAPAHLLVRGDSEGLAQVIDNLVDNALKFSPLDARVHISVCDLAARGDRVAPERWAALRRTAALGGAILISVADEGPGIPDEEKERVFTRFYQTDAGRAVRSRGVGLGLTICQEIVAAHGGAIWVDDNRPRGSLFQVLLPDAGRTDAETQVPALAAGRGRPA